MSFIFPLVSIKSFYFSMSSLHIWVSKLKWSMEVLLRFYERHAFICALHKETKLLFDELIFCLQRLYCVPFHLDMPFNDSILEEISTVEMIKRRDHCTNCACNRTPTSGSEVRIKELLIHIVADAFRK